MCVASKAYKECAQLVLAFLRFCIRLQQAVAFDHVQCVLALVMHASMHSKAIVVAAAFGSSNLPRRACSVDIAFDSCEVLENLARSACF